MVKRLNSLIADLLGPLIDRRVAAEINRRLSQIAGSAPEILGIHALHDRIAGLEERVLDYYANRWHMIDKAVDYLVGAEIPGEYFEFGVFKGRTFAYACKAFGRVFPKLRFVAVDSFSGLPELGDVDTESGYSSGFHKGQFACSLDEFRSCLTRNGVNLDRVVVVDGWFDETLRPGSPKIAGLDKVAVAWIDCDLYESTVPVLDFLTSRMSVGTLLLFDDWHCFRNLADRGEQRACREWLERNPQIRLNPLVDFGFHGESFTVAAC